MTDATTYDGIAEQARRQSEQNADEMRRQVQERVAEEAARSALAAGSSPSGSAPSGNGDRGVVTSQFINECLFANELGDGVMYATLYRDKFLYCKNTLEWFEWAGHCWQRDTMGHSLAAVEKVVEHYLAEFKRVSAELANILALGESAKSDVAVKLEDKKDALLKRARNLRSTRRRSNCLEFAHTIESPLAITGEEFDNRPMLFPCANGVIDLETGRLKPGRPGDYLSLASPIEFLGIDTPAPIWERTLLEIFGGDPKLPPGHPDNARAEALVAYLQRLLGYAMTGLVKEKVFPVLYGPTGWNGRSLIIETVSYVMGALAGSIPSEMLLSQKYAKSSSAPSPDIMSLKGVRMAFASEIDEGQKFSAAKIKWLTGKDEMVGRNPHDKFQTRFTPTHKLFLMTNTQPEAPPNDKAFWERLHLIPFAISFVNRDPQEPHERRAITDLDQQIRAEASGILAWLVRGCLFYQQQGLNPPLEITAATEEYRRGEDVLADFIDECCIREDGAKEKANVLYKRYVTWYHDNIGEKERTGTWFGKQLKLKFKKTKISGCVTYHGICLKDVQGEIDT